jgi:hypothetical protein
MVRHAFALFALAVLLVTTGAHADDDAAEKLFREGRAALRNKDWDTACARFEESAALVERVGTLLNLGFCNEQRGQRARAWTFYERSLAALEPSDPRHAATRERQAKLEPSIARLRFRDPGDGVRATIEGVGVDLAHTTALEPGTYVITLTAEGREDRPITLAAAAGTEIEIEATPGRPLPGDPPHPGPIAREEVPVAPPPVAPPRATAPAPPTKRAQADVIGWDAQRIAAAGVGALGVGALIAGSVFGGLAFDHQSRSDALCGGPDCPDTEAGHAAVELGDDAQTYATLTNVFLIGGTALLGAGLVVWLTAPNGQEAAHIEILPPGRVRVRF